MLKKILHRCMSAKNSITRGFRLFTVPYFFRVIVEIERVLLLMAAILIFRCTEGVGVREVDLILFHRLDSVRLKIKMAPINGKTRSKKNLTQTKSPIKKSNGRPVNHGVDWMLYSKYRLWNKIQFQKILPILNNSSLHWASLAPQQWLKEIPPSLPTRQE